MTVQRTFNSEDIANEIKLTDTGTQTGDLFPYECLFMGILDQKSQNFVQESPDSRLSPVGMLDRYIEACTRVNNFFSNNGKMSKYKIIFIIYNKQIPFRALVCSVIV